MNPTLRNILAVIAGLILGMAANMGFLMLGSKLIPFPEGVDFMNAESIKSNMHLFELKHFLTPFIAHSSQALLGAFVACKLGASKHLVLAMVIGILSLIGGVANSFQIPAPLWYDVVDIALAYIPMAWIGYKLSGK